MAAAPHVLGDEIFTYAERETVQESEDIAIECRETDSVLSRSGLLWISLWHISVAKIKQLLDQYSFFYLGIEAGREKMGNPGMRFPENFASSREIFTDFLKKILR